nr:MAG TPA: tailspike protein [Caudoviricetes sp.]
MSTITQFPSGSTQYRIEFDYLARTFVVVTLVNSFNPTLNRVLEVGRDYRFLNPTMVEMLVDQSGFDIVRIHRQTGTDLVVDFRNGSVLTASDLTNAELQAIHIAEEGRDQTVDLAKEYADAAGNSAGNAKDSEDEARRIAESIKEAGLIGYITRRSFENGFNVTTWNEVLLWEEDGDYYRWDGTLPKNVPAGSTPETSGGIGLGAWVSVGDASLRSDLSQSTGAELLGYGASTVKDALDSVVNKRVLYFSQFGTLQSLQSYITSNNLKSVEIIFDKVVNFGPGSGGLSTIVTLSNMDYLEIRGLVIRDTLLYSGSFDLTRVFDLTNITNLVFEVDASSTLEYVGDSKRGLTPLRLNGCDNFTFIGKTSKCYQGYECANVKTLYARSVNNDTRYPHLLGNVGVVDIYTVNNGCRRDFFLTNNCGGGDITVDAVDTQQGTPIKMYFYNGNMDNQISNLTINYKYRSTGRYTLPYRVAPIWLDWGWDSTTTETMIAGLMRNITINYDVVGGNWGSVIGTTKLIDESVADNNPRGYAYSNIVITGRIELGGGDSGNHAWFFNFNSNNNWSSGDSINGFICRDLVVRKLNGGDVYVNTNQLTGAVVNYGGVTFDNVNAPEAKLTATDYSKVKFRDCTFSDFTSTGATPDVSKSASGSLVFLKAAGDSRNFKLGTVSTYRNVSLWDVDIVANSPFSGVSSAWHGKIQGTIVMGTTPAPSTMEGSVQSTFTKGTAATPTISVDTSGNVFLNFAGWEALDANIAVNVRMQYNQYSGGGNKTVRGMLSKADGGFSLNLS